MNNSEDVGAKEMRIRTNDVTRVSFGRLSDPGVLEQSPLAKAGALREMFNAQNIRYIVNNITDMFGYAQGMVDADVKMDDYMPVWYDLNANNQVDEGEITFTFTMNAEINIYERKSTYGQNFISSMASQYGYPITFGIIAHEIGHMVAHYALDILEQRIIDGRPALVGAYTIDSYWDELCADYLAGVVLAKSAPPLSQEPMKQFLGATVAGDEHPDGFWRVLAVEMGYLWGKNNSASATDAVLTSTETQKQLLISFFTSFYQGVYLGVNNDARATYCKLSNVLMKQSQIVLGYL